MLRNLGYLAGWAATTAAVVGLGWAAVGAVTGAVTDPPPLAQPPAAPPAAAEEAPADATEAPPPGEATGPDPAAVPGEDRAGTRSFDMAGGTVAVTVRADAVELLFATPRPGFAVDVRSRGPSRVDVRFSSEDHESRFRYDPEGGADLEERAD